MISLDSLVSDFACIFNIRTQVPWVIALFPGLFQAGLGTPSVDLPPGCRYAFLKGAWYVLICTRVLFLLPEFCDSHTETFFYGWIQNYYCGFTWACDLLLHFLVDIIPPICFLFAYVISFQKISSGILIHFSTKN